ncbi:LPXTG cell wall anchor domain-containing protein [archaeon]|jgi:LPXTG-motif cell wall-anchored protein|nr:LPXTG cell wall anchor domain-containing protein [Candidatus Woesearchaeota archaeon]MBT3720868.1 LPXTG cell wall anchor domain-containing protein [archaeon]MBT4023114.1 LPXTG cell wall anchor domain-containing protein [archaeon]MBT4460771.1 LPXTG cell wall anchor domain-containing protein [archaeon]MBT5424406.1 LPXTG cell wall anchor domain-containing protein [archaeon]
MNKSIFIMLFIITIMFQSVLAISDPVEVVVLGVVTHGPMQPTVRAIEEVTAKYGSQVNTKWIDFESDEGEKYAQDHGLTTHMTILINEKYEYDINGKEIVFQWFEGGQWTKEDLDIVISNSLNPTETVSVSKSVGEKSNLNIYYIIGIVLVALIGVGWLYFRKKRQ